MTLKKTLAAFALVTLCLCSTVGAYAGDTAEAPKKTSAAKAPAVKVSINSATAEQLEALPRIGPKTAQRIVEYRKAHKSFRTVDELLNVKGVGPKVLEKIRPHVTL